MKSVSLLKNLKGKKVLVRADFNTQTEEDSLRLFKTLPTLKHLKKQKAKIVIISHRGKPRGRVVPELSLKPTMKFLKKHFGRVVFLSGDVDEKMVKKVDREKPGTIFLLENIRFYRGEEQESAAFSKKLAKLGDFYVNEAFPASHRKSASLTLLPKLLPAYAGLLLQEEIKNLSKVLKNPKRPLVVILAGGKAKDKFSVIENLYPATDKFLIGGILANTFLRSQGMPVSGSVVEESLLTKVKKYFFDEKIVLPLDWMGDDEQKIVDIGPMTRKYYASVIEGAGTVIWAGPVGIFEDVKSRQGSMAIARAIARSRAFSVVGGGETTQLLLSMGLTKEISFVSTGGGAMLAFLAGEDLPALEALK